MNKKFALVLKVFSVFLTVLITVNSILASGLEQAPEIENANANQEVSEVFSSEDFSSSEENINQEDMVPSPDITEVPQKQEDFSEDYECSEGSFEDEVDLVTQENGAVEETTESPEIINTLESTATNSDLKISLYKESGFSEGDTVEVAVLKDNDLSAVVDSLEYYLADKHVEVVLPLGISVSDREGNQLKIDSPVTVRVFTDISNFFNGSVVDLYHLKSNGEWEKLNYNVIQSNEIYVEFTTNSFSPFMFVQTSDNISEGESGEGLGTENTEGASEPKNETEADSDVSNVSDEKVNTKEESEQKDETELGEEGSSEIDFQDTKETYELNSLSDDVEPIIIDTFEVSFSNGASLKDGVYVWNPSDSVKNHAFVYRVDYSMSGTFSLDKGVFTIEFPLHILKDRNGNWADTFDCPYLLESEVTEDMESPNFVYRIDEENNKAIIYNYNPHPTGDAGYIEFSYLTTENTYAYADGVLSDTVPVTVYATNEAATVTATDEAEAVSIDTHATLSYTQKKTPSYHSKWLDAWGERPEDADDYVYLVWTIRSYVNKNTSPYDFYLEDTFTNYEGEVVGYRFSGQTEYSEINHVDGITNYGDRYDYVLTRYRKDAVADIVTSEKRYEVYNEVTARVSPVDHVDEDTTAFSSKSWWYERRLLFGGQSGNFWAEKYGVYGKYATVDDSEDVTDFTLFEFQNGDKDRIDNLRYYINGNALPYPWTLPDGVEGTVEDAMDGLFGQKKVDFELVDDVLYLDDSKTPLLPEDYDITGIEWNPLIRSAVFDEASGAFKEIAVSEYSPEDAITIWVKTDSGNWVQAAVYDMVTKSYININNTYVKSASGKQIDFYYGVKGFKFTCSNAYYHTRLIAYPEVSLNRTDNVLSMIGSGTGKEKVSLTNQGVFRVTQKDKTLFERTISGKDYIQGVLRESEINKNIIQTKNLKKESRFIVTWRVNVQESYADQTGIHSIYQQNGVFYDLLPAGAVPDISSLSVTASEKALVSGDFDVTTIDNYKNSGRTMMQVVIKEPTSDKYVLTYDTVHSYDTIKDYGKNLLNSVAYETGNERIAEGYPDDGGTITDKNLMQNLDANTDAKKFLYTEARYELAIMVAASTGLKKSVKNSSDTLYSYETTVHAGETYTYQIRLANDAVTKSKDVVFFDSLENFYQSTEETSPTLPSDWHGTFRGVNLSNLTYKGVNPMVYLSKMEGLNIQNHHNLKERIDGERVWVPYDTFVSAYGLEAAQAIAIDASKKMDGSDFILDLKESVSFEIYMEAPKSDVSVAKDPVTYNNIYVERTAMKDSGGDISEIPQFYHQDYTTVHYRVVSDIALKKVDKIDMETPVKGVTYKLQGTSDYGTVYAEERISDRDGLFSFKGIEKGTYELFEVSCSDDWQLNTEVYKVVIDGTGTLSIAGLTKDEESIYLVADEPRVHADFMFYKRDSITKRALENVEFRLMGVSSYDNDVLVYASSDVNGKVSFSNLELGTYDLVEVKTVDGYIKSNQVWTVVVAEPGIAFLYEDDTELPKSLDGYYQLENEPYHSVRFVKSSTYGENVYLEGAEFSLTGVSDYGTEVNATAVSASADDGGLVVFDNLEPGTYILKETKAPEEHDLNPLSYTVIVHKDGSYEIEGLGTTKFGNADVYDFKDTKTTGTVCVTKKWVDNKTNEERSTPDITISTQLPGKNPLGYTVTYNANGGTFGDNSTVRNIVYNSSNVIVDGSYMSPTKSDLVFLGWYTDAVNGELVDISDTGIPVNKLTSDMTLYAQWKTVVLKEGTEFKKLVPSSATSAEFVYEKAPEGATLINVDEDGDGGVVGWVDEGVFKISTQLEGVKSIANTNCFKMFNDRTLTSIKFDALDTSKVTNMQEMFSGCRNLLYLDISSFDTHNVTNMKYMFHYLTSIKNLDVSMLDTSSATNMYAMFGNCVMLKSLDVSNFDTSKVTDMQEMFRCCSSLTDLDLSSFDTSNVKIMYKMFYDCNSLVNLNVSGFNVEKVGNMSNMFYNCKNLTSLDISSFKTNSATNMSSMFYNCSNISELDVSGFNTTNVTDMSYMFYNCGKVSSLDTTNFKTSNVTNMARMFQNCISITSVLDVSGFDTSKVVNMSGMFFNCNASEIDVSGFDTSNVTTMDDMFLGCRGLTVLDVSNFVTDKVTSFRNMFAYCCNVDVLDVSNFNTENVIDMHGMFYYCAKLTSLNLSNFNTEKVTLMGDMFNTCQSLTELDLSSFDTKNLTEMYGMFYNCSFLEVLNLSSFNTEKVEKMKGVFYNIIRLRKLLLGDSFSIMSDTDIPAPSANYVPGADGYWYNSSGDAFAPSEIPSNVADTYYSSILLVP